MDTNTTETVVIDPVTYAVTETETTEVPLEGGHRCIITTANMPESTIIFTTDPNGNHQNNNTETIIATTSESQDGKALYETILPFTIVPVTSVISSVNQKSTTTTTIRWTYTSGAQVNPNGGIPRVRPSSVLAALIAANPMIELDRWCKYTNRYTATCHTCARTFTKVTPKALAAHARTMKHRTVFEPLPVASSSAAALTTSPITGSTSAAEIARLKKLASLVARYPDFGLVDERDLAQNEIFEYDLPPDERHLKVNDVYCKVCRRKLVAAQTRYYHRAILDHLNTNKHQAEVEKKVAVLEGRAPPVLQPPKKISRRVDKAKQRQQKHRSEGNQEGFLPETPAKNSQPSSPKRRVNLLRKRR